MIVLTFETNRLLFLRVRRWRGVVNDNLLDVIIFLVVHDLKMDVFLPASITHRR